MENGLSSYEKILESNIVELENKLKTEKIFLQYEKK